MTEYIEKEKAIGMAISGRIRTLPTTEAGEDWIRVKEVRESLQSIPAADVVPVVRCKDCKYRHDDGFCGGRGWPAQLMPDDGYCNSGARMDGDT